jgi:SAM-dependent methyltransferase
VTAPETLHRTSFDELNRRRYAGRALPRVYASSEGLQEPERVILATIADEVRDQPIIDIGVGAGRTTEHLRRLSNDYLGVDYSAAMVAACRRRHPDAEFLQLDARDLDRFADESFGLVMFAFNGIDCIDHDDRIAVLGSFHRILRPGGWLVLSSHNRDAPVVGYRLPPFYPSRHPVRLATRAVAWAVGAVRAVVNRRRLRRLEYETDGYAIRNDDAHEHSLLTYYVRAPDQITQLRQAGFTADIAVHALDGHRLAPGETSHDPWLYYAVRR